MKHYRNFSLFSLLLLLALSPAWAQKVIGNGKVVEENRSVSAFTSIEVSNGWDLFLKQDGSHKMKIVADENFLPHLKTEVSNGVLKIYSDVRLQKYKSKSRSRIYLSIDQLESIIAEGGSDIRSSSTIKVESLKLRLSGGSDLEQLDLQAKSLVGEFSGGSDADITFESIQNIDIKARGGSDLSFDGIKGASCNLNLSGGSDADLSGSVNEMVVTAVGGSDLEAYGLQVKSCKLNLSGSSDANIKVSDTMEIVLSGGSDLSCVGNPKITYQDVCKSCDIAMGQ